jgi:uncharacterized repeat protein (TIGR03803 family)
MFRTSVALAALFVAGAAVSRAQTFTKLHDLQVTTNELGEIIGAAAPWEAPTLVGDTLYFTTEGGGSVDRGTLSSFHLPTATFTQLVSLNNATGQDAKGPVLVLDGCLYFITSRGGIGDAGSIIRFDPATSNTTVLVQFPATNMPGHIGRFSQSNLLPVPDGLGGHDLYFTTFSGAAFGYGSIAKFNTTSNTLSTIVDFTQTNGRQPYRGLTRHHNRLFVTTFTGGTNSGTGFPNGAGTVSAYDLVTRSFTKLADLPTNHGAFPACAPIVLSNQLYFTTAGSTARPGGLARLDLASSTFTQVVAFTGTNLGRQPYGAPVFYEGGLYFLTLNGGITNRGALIRYDIATETHTKLVDFLGTNGSQNGANSYAGLTRAVRGSNVYLYGVTRSGGAFNKGVLFDLHVGTVESAFPSWQITQFGSTNDPFSAAGGDADDDQVVNLLEYACDGDPWSAASRPLPALVLSNGVMAFTVPRNSNAVDVTFHVEHSSTLLDWNEIHAFSATDAPAGDVTIEIAAPADPGARSLLRLNVSHP